MWQRRRFYWRSATITAAGRSMAVTATAATAVRAAATAAEAAAMTPPATTTHGGKQPILEHCCDPLIRGKNASEMQGEGKRFSVQISFLMAGNHGGECSMDGDGLRAEGEFLTFIWLVSMTTGDSRVRHSSGRFELLDFLLDGYLHV